ncbi:hypothetical protein LTR95_013506 [Oleoguttula sp. CCFEE 5521]
MRLSVEHLRRCDWSWRQTTGPTSNDDGVTIGMRNKRRRLAYHGEVGQIKTALACRESEELRLSASVARTSVRVKSVEQKLAAAEQEYARLGWERDVVKESGQRLSSACDKSVARIMRLRETLAAARQEDARVSVQRYDCSKERKDVEARLAYMTAIEDNNQQEFEVLVGRTRTDAAALGRDDADLEQAFGGRWP